MEHFYQKIHGWFNYEQLYSDMVRRFGDGSRFVEVGSWLGRSAAYLGVEIINSGKNIFLYCVDTWDASDIAELKEEEVVRNKTLYSDFIRNIEPLKSVIQPIRDRSAAAAMMFEDESLDFVFIDADHSEKGINEDIDCWLPKVKKGGVFAGHDYDYPQIKKAVNTRLSNFEVIEPNIWVHQK